MTWFQKFLPPISSNFTLLYAGKFWRRRTTGLPRDTIGRSSQWKNKTWQYTRRCAETKEKSFSTMLLSWLYYFLSCSSETGRNIILTHGSLRSRILESLVWDDLRIYDVNFNQAALRATTFTSMHCTPSFTKSVSQLRALWWHFISHNGVYATFTIMRSS